MSILTVACTFYLSPKSQCVSLLSVSFKLRTAHQHRNRTFCHSQQGQQVVNTLARVNKLNISFEYGFLNIFAGTIKMRNLVVLYT